METLWNYSYYELYKASHYNALDLALTIRPTVRSTEAYKLLHSLLRYFDPPLRRAVYAGLYNDLCFFVLKNRSNKIADLTVSAQTVSVRRHIPNANWKNLTRNIQTAAEDFKMASPKHSAACVTPLHTADKLNATSVRRTQKHVIARACMKRL